MVFLDIKRIWSDFSKCCNLSFSEIFAQFFQNFLSFSENFSVSSTIPQFFGNFSISITIFADFDHKMYDFVQICLKWLIFGSFASLYAQKLLCKALEKVTKNPKIVAIWVFSKIAQFFRNLLSFRQKTASVSQKWAQFFEKNVQKKTLKSLRSLFGQRTLQTRTI